MANVFEQLKQSAEKSVKELHLPEELASAVMDIYKNRERYSNKEQIIMDLAEMLLEFNINAKIDCDKYGASTRDIAYVINYIRYGSNQV